MSRPAAAGPGSPLRPGTLTKAEMTLQQVYASGRLHAVSGVGYASDGAVEDPTPAVAHALRAATLCSDARLLAPSGDGGWRVLGDTTEGAVVVGAAKAGIDLAAETARTPRVGVFPSDPDRKLMTTLHRVDGTVGAHVKGSPESVLERCTEARFDGRDVALDMELRQQVEDADDATATRGLRVLADATRAVTSERVSQEEAEGGLTFLGLVGIADLPRPEVTAAVAACRRAGIAIYMVTGDHGLTAEAIARRVGIIDEGPARVVTGAELDTTSEKGLAETLRAGGQVLFARGLHVVTGDAGAPRRLEAAWALGADVLVACTGHDEENLVISVLARRHFEIARVVATVRDDADRWLFDQGSGVDAAISSATALVALIEEATGSARTDRLADLAEVGLVLVEINVTVGSAAAGRSVAELSLPRGELVAAVVRHGRPMPVDDAPRLRVGGRVLVVTDPEGESLVHGAFSPDMEGAPQ
ncbi:MAG TPA: NAD-binding protein [Acidimicrobiales bacterium]|nr:NAD-binding protein [Acidimicrobiales bacterium]